MITIATVTEELINQTPFVEEGIASGLINLSALARELKPKIEERLIKEVQTGAIIMALKRLVPHYQNRFRELDLVMSQLTDLTVKSNLVGYTFVNSPQLAPAIDELLAKKSRRPSRFFTLSQGVYETALIVDREMQPLVDELFASEQVVLKLDQLSSLTIKLPPINVQVPGVYYAILKMLAWEGVNLTDIVSTANELTLLMEDQYIDRVFSLLKKRQSKY